MFFMRLFFLRTSTPQPVEHGDQLVAGHRGLPAGRSVLIAGNESLLQGPGPGLRAPGGVGLPAAQLLQILPGQAQASTGVKVFPVSVSMSMAAAVGPQPEPPMVARSPGTR